MITYGESDGTRMKFVEKENNTRWKMNFTKNDMFPLKMYKLGEIKVVGPNNYKAILIDTYGERWMIPRYTLPHQVIKN